MEEIVSLIQSIVQFLLSILDGFFGTHHDNNKPNQRGGKKRKINYLR